MLHIDRNKALEMLAKAVELKGGDYVYNNPEESLTSGTGCVYVHHQRSDNPEPGCIVGTALHLYGIPLSVMSGSAADSSPAFRLLEYLSGQGLLSYTPGATDVFSMAQSRQDMGSTWGYALSTATHAK